MQLNNFLQSHYGNTNMLTWEFEYVGPDNDCMWRAIAFSNEFLVSFSSFQTDFTVRKIVNGVEYGRGEKNKQKGPSAEAAARQTLIALRGY